MELPTGLWNQLRCQPCPCLVLPGRLLSQFLPLLHTCGTQPTPLTVVKSITKLWRTCTTHWHNTYAHVDLMSFLVFMFFVLFLFVITDLRTWNSKFLCFMHCSVHAVQDPLALLPRLKLLVSSPDTWCVGWVTGIFHHVQWYYVAFIYRDANFWPPRK